MADVATLISALNDYGFEDSSTATKVREIQNAIRDIEKRQPWPFLDTEVTVTFDGISISLSPQPNWRAVIHAKNYVSGKRIRPVTAKDFDEQVVSNAAEGTVGEPLIYYFVASDIRVWPVPPADHQIVLRYIRYSEPITSSSEEGAILIPPRYHEAIQLGALLRLYDMEDDPELAVRFEARYEKIIAEMVEDAFRQQYDQPDYIHVDDPDNWDLDI